MSARLLPHEPVGFKVKVARLTHATHTDRTVINMCPCGDEAVTRCCGRSPLELPTAERMTVDQSLVTCGVETMRETKV